MKELTPSFGSIGESRSGTNDAFSAIDEMKAIDNTTLNDNILAEKEAIKKDDDDFAKLEAQFIADLGLKPEELPGFAKNIVLPKTGK